MMDNKRKLPDKEKMGKRIKYMKYMKELTAIEPVNKAVPNGLERGNGKTGNSGKLFDKIFIWNLPPVITCPGISDWCKHNCYNADDRYDKFPINKWCENLWWVLNDRKALKERISSQLEECKTKKTVPAVSFWAYTRSWAVEELLEKIKESDDLDNIKLILSWDETMKPPLDGFAKSIVYSSNYEINTMLNVKGGVVCPEQYNLVPSCADCGICINKLLGDIYFVLH